MHDLFNYVFINSYDKTNVYSVHCLLLNTLLGIHCLKYHLMFDVLNIMHNSYISDILVTFLRSVLPSKLNINVTTLLLYITFLLHLMCMKYLTNILLFYIINLYKVCIIL